MTRSGAGCHLRAGAQNPGLAGIIRLIPRELAARVAFLEAPINSAVARRKRMTDEFAPRPVAMCGVGPDTASTLLLTAGDKPDRLRSERSFAGLTGSFPVPATSGLMKTRHRLNRGGEGRAGRDVLQGHLYVGDSGVDPEAHLGLVVDPCAVETRRAAATR